MKQKRAGPPTKAQQLKNREERSQIKAVEEKIRAKELLCSNYHTYMELLHKIATNNLDDKRDVTVAAQATTLKTLIGIYDEMFKQELDEEDSNTPAQSTPKNEPLISLSFEKKVSNE